MFPGIVGGNILPTKKGNMLLSRHIPLTYYRGERKDYGNLRASIYRNGITPDIDEDLDLFIKMMKIQEFGLMINSLNRVKIWRNPPIEFKKLERGTYSKGLFLDVEGLAQHYGMPTRYLDFSNNVDIALFFACTKYDAINNRYVPLSEEDIVDSPMGVVYAFPIGTGMTEPSSYERDRIRILPVQPFMRSYIQAGFAYLDDCGPTPSRILKYKFRHDIGLCNFLYDKFEGGRGLFPKDGIPWLLPEIEKIKKSFHCSEESFENTCEQFGYDTQRSGDIMSMLEDIGFSIGKKSYDIS